MQTWTVDVRSAHDGPVHPIGIPARDPRSARASTASTSSSDRELAPIRYLDAGLARDKTPDEMYFGTAGNLTAELATAKSNARAARLAAARAISRGTCIGQHPAFWKSGILGDFMGDALAYTVLRNVCVRSRALATGGRHADREWPIPAMWSEVAIVCPNSTMSGSRRWRISSILHPSAQAQVLRRGTSRC